MHELAADLVRADPMTARQVGALDSETGAPTLRLPSLDPSEHDRQEALLLWHVAPVTAIVGTRPWLEERCIQAEVARRLQLLRDGRPWARAPYWYAECLGEALTAVDAARLGDRTYAAHYLDLLADGAVFLDTGRGLLTAAQVPARWAAMTVGMLPGLRALVADLGQLSSALPPGLAAEADRRRAVLTEALVAFGVHAESLARLGQGDWTIGEEAFTGLLRDVHCLELSAQQVWEHGWASVARAETQLTELAATLDPTRTWNQQVAALKAERTPAERFVAAYREEVERSLRETVEHDLLTVPDGQECLVEALPTYLRAGLPMGELRAVPAYAETQVSRLRITRADTGDPERLAQHERENCPTFIRSIAGHETYPGHHLQSVHHRLSTGEDEFLRFFRSPLFVEGWGLYVEDVLEERVWGQGTQALFARRNRLWRALRLVIDTGLHTGRMTHAQAVALLMERAGMDRHLAEGEADRYTRHDNPTYPSTYVLGRDIFLDLRRRFGRDAASLSVVHDAFLRHGSPPVSLLDRVLERASARPAPGQGVGGVTDRM